MNGKKSKNTTAIKNMVSRLRDFLRNDVGKRKFAVEIDKDDLARVLMKIDIEGSEIDVIRDILFTGGLQYVNKVMTEWNKRFKK